MRPIMVTPYSMYLGFGGVEIFWVRDSCWGLARDGPGWIILEMGWLSIALEL